MWGVQMVDASDRIRRFVGPNWQGNYHNLPQHEFVSDYYGVRDFQRLLSLKWYMKSVIAAISTTLGVLVLGTSPWALRTAVMRLNIVLRGIY